MTIPATTDLCDAHEGRIASGSLQVAQALFQRFGGASAFCGPAVTVRAFEDNSLVRPLLEEAGQGRVLVVDGGGSMRCAMVGGNLGKLGQQNGWAGIVVNGCVRDTAELAEYRVGIRALGTHPQKSRKQGAGERDVQVRFAGVTIAPGNWIYADLDGMLIADQRLEK